ncbi:MAG: hypothetical protein U9R38_06190 [Candidatus Margulisiibacteriota bacterium]|nr:hypothetical protein [Candidatus Margulisiibacteriota bacterium]
MLNKPIALFLSFILILALSTPLLAAKEKTKSPKDEAIKVETSARTITEIKGGKKTITRIARFTVRRSAPYAQDFNVKDYKNALQSDKLIVLLFSADGLKPGGKEYEHMKEAFKKLKVRDVIAFKVNYHGKNSDRAQKKLAETFKVKKAGTKILIKNGGKLEQTDKPWDKMDYIKKITVVQKM